MFIKDEFDDASIADQNNQIIKGNNFNGELVPKDEPHDDMVSKCLKNIFSLYTYTMYMM